MDREAAREHIRPLLSEYLDSITTKKGKMYICPICGSGSGNNGHYTPALSVTGEKWKCFSCNNGGDIYSLIALQNGIDSSKDFYKVLDIAAAALLAALQDLLNRVRAGEVTTEQANRESSIISNALRAYEQTELKTKLEALEAALRK